MVIYTKEQSRTNLNGLILKYEKNKKDEEFSKNESQIINSLIRPFVNHVLGWETEDPSEYKVESHISGKRSDILVCSNGVTQFIIEAKSLAVDIVNNNDFYKQAMTYAYAKDKTFAILTNFRHFIILRCDVEIEPWKAAVKVIDLEQIKDEEFDLIYCFSKQFWTEKGEQNPLYSKLKDYKKRVKIDLRLLDDLKEWRQLLLNNILNHPKQNKYDFSDEKTKYGIEEEVQRFIDRIIFVCYTEDKGFHDPQIKLLSDEKKDKHFSSPSWLLGKIHELFNLYWSKYNSDLFKHGKCDEFFIEDGTLLKIFEELRKPKDRLPYDIASIEADILGKTYENFIGHVISGEKRLKEKESKGKRKEMGIYYTPTYIVDYIVRNTVGEYIKGKPFSSINKVKILDPACGSGSFLIKAFDILIEESRAALGREPNYSEKKSLLLNCIHGVDLDERAVDICKLNLSLKLAERGEKLPELHENIKCGNSLIDDESVAGFKAFKWEIEFKEIMQNGGFDVVIGNPPYIFARSGMFSESEKEYYYKKFSLVQYQLNTYLLFVEMGIKLLKAKGFFGFIIPNTWQTIDNFSKFRKFLFENISELSIVNVIDKVFSEANVDTSILTFNNLRGTQHNVKLFSSVNSKFEKIFEGDPKNLGQDYVVRFSNSSYEEINNIMEKIESKSILLENISIVKAGLKAYEVGKGAPKQTENMKNNRIYHSNKRIDKTYFRYLSGKDVCRYSIKWGGLFLKYGNCLAAPRDFELFNSERIVVRQIPSKPPYCINAILTDEVYLNDINSMIVYNIKNYDSKYILSLLNSKLISFWFNSKFNKLQRGIFPQFKVKELKIFPIPKNSSKEIQKLIFFSDKMLTLNKKLQENPTSHEKQKIEEEIKRTDKEIDELVYQLYGITEEEKKIIEESLK